MNLRLTFKIVFYFSLAILKREETGERHKEEGDDGSEKNENIDTENLKVPTLTISLRPGSASE